MRIGGLAVAIVLAIAAFSWAAPLDPKVVSGEAKWVVHLDVDAMRDSSLVRTAYQEFVDKCPLAKVALPALDAARAQIGFDPRTDLHGLTLYGSQVGKEEGVLIVFADANQKMLTEKVKNAPGYKSETHGAYELHSWTHKDRRGERPVTGAFFKDKAAVFSGSPEEVKAALDVMDGKKPGSTCEVLAAEVPAGATVLVRAVGIDQTPCDSKLAKEIESFSIASGENAGQSFFHGKVVAKSPQVAKEMAKVAKGLQGLGNLHAIDQPQCKPLVKNMKVKVEGSTLTVDNTAPADVLWKHMQTEIKKAIEKHQKRGKK